ncbi:hypothetical protein D8B26_M00330 (mitochondrion) [Coccidioides posadasii str. Silveira]|uniref:uncharacterized protein n=1 Tax=Coccidioides posadasii (strain RMSCC 757 / Silveira) TaxID=443226 RepID=UPI001D00FF4F|nr:hypothetical protein LI437_mgp41 [Coccidioides posadasii]QVG61951.1 hypothetical protein [Coccidioides posadasii]UKA47929.1 hypothetical protein D8B26_M00330 [Coccidioides posadasii str. Silveira]
MLNIIKSKLNNSYKNLALNTKNITINPKKFGGIVRNWKNSIYVYNKNTLKLIPEASKLTIKLIKGYFNLYNIKLEKKIKKISLGKNLRKRKISKNRIFISNGEFKHTNDLVNITIYFYNRQLLNYKNLIWKKYIKLFRKQLLLNKKLLLIRNKGSKYLNEENKKKNIIIQTLNIKDVSKIKKIENYQITNYKNFIKKSLAKIIIYIYLKQLIYINKYKFNNYYLQNLINIIKKIYKKNIQFNFINVKYFYLNSDILTESLILKLRKNRKKLLSYLKTIIRKTKIKKIKYNPNTRYIFNIKELKLINNNNNIDITNKLLYDLMLNNKTRSKYLKRTIFNNINYKRVSGIRLQVAGRLTRRFTASRSISKIIYKGSLLDVHSSIKGNSSTLLRGNNRPNLEYTKLNSKTRIGSFGVKGWISGV